MYAESRTADSLTAAARKSLVFLVGPSRFELLTCRLGGGRSIQLSYVPVTDSL